MTSFGRQTRLSPAEMHGVTFHRTPIGRRGYDEQEVERFLHRVRDELTHLIAEKSNLREELDRIRRRFRSPDHLDANDQRADFEVEEAQAQAMQVLVKAQQTADQYVADAEDYSRKLAANARQHYEEVVYQARSRAGDLLEDAHRRAEEAAQVAARAYQGTGENEQRELERQIAYLRTFSQVCRVQLRSYLEGLIRTVEEEWERANPVPVGAEPPDGGITLPGGRPAVPTVTRPAPRPESR